MREQVLALLQRHLPGPFKPVGPNVMCRCPFHKGGEERKESFSVHLEKGVFNCFTCKVTGGLPYLLRLLGVARATIDAEMAPLKPMLERARELHRLENENFFVGRDPFKAPVELPEGLLGIYEYLPLRLVEQGFDPALLQDMEIGYDVRNQRITYPIRDMYGTLGGISGGATLPEQHPKYKVYEGGGRLPSGRVYVGDFGKWFDENYPHYHFDNRAHLWNFDRVLARLEGTSDSSGSFLILVEGFKAALWLIQCGYLNTVALMGSTITETQARMLHRLGVQVLLFLDNDEPGRKGTIVTGDKLWRPLYGRLSVPQYPAEDRDTQPDDYVPEGVHCIVQGSLPYLQHRQLALRSDTVLRDFIEKRKTKPW